MYGTINFESFPAGANIIIDGMSQNSVTPCTVENIPYGDYEFQLSMDGFNTIIGYIRVDTYSVINIYAQLHQYIEGFGGIEIWSVPYDAVVLINEHTMDITTPIIITEVPPGEYLIEVMKKDYVTYSCLVIVKEGMTELMNVKFEKQSVKDFQQIVKSSMAIIGAIGLMKFIEE